MEINTFAQLQDQAKHWQSHTVERKDGSAARYAFWEVSQPRGHVLIAPGRNERPMKYTEVASNWAARGYQSLCIDPDPDFNQQLADFKLIADQAFKPRAGSDFALVQGHSTGAHSALRHADTTPLIVSAPLVGINYRTRGVPDFAAAAVTSLFGLAKPDNFAWGQKPYTRAGLPFEGNRWTGDRNSFAIMQDMFDDETYAPHGAKWGWIRAAQKSCTLLQRELPNIQAPILLLATPNDRAVSGPAQNLIKQAVRVDFPESGHEIFMESRTIRARAWSAIDQFVFTLRQNRSPSL